MGYTPCFRALSLRFFELTRFTRCRRSAAKERLPKYNAYALLIDELKPADVVVETVNHDTLFIHAADHATLNNFERVPWCNSQIQWK